jgi:hypothetical protein
MRLAAGQESVPDCCSLRLVRALPRGFVELLVSSGRTTPDGKFEKIRYGSQIDKAVKPLVAQAEHFLVHGVVHGRLAAFGDCRLVR